MDKLSEALTIISHLKAYGMIHTVKGVVYPEGSHEDFIKRADDFISNFDKSDDNRWIYFDPNDKDTIPKEYGKYFVQRKDGKVHWETWNGSGWAYNGNTIVFYKKILGPIKTT